MGCIQSKTIARPTPTADKRKTRSSNGINGHSSYQSHKTDETDGQTHLKLDMRSPRTDASTSGLSNGYLGSSRLQFAEDLEPVTALPDTMTICSASVKGGPLSVSNVSIKNRESAHSSRVQTSYGTSDLSIEELDTEMDEFSRLRHGSRYIHHPGHKINPPTTDILLPRRKQTPYPTESITDRQGAYVKMTGTKTIPSSIKEETETNITINQSGNSGSAGKSSARKTKYNKKGGKTKKREMKTKRNSASDETLMEIEKPFSSIEGTIKIDNAEKVSQLLNEDQTPEFGDILTSTDNVNDNTETATKPFRNDTDYSRDSSTVFTFTGVPVSNTKDNSTEKLYARNEVEITTHEVVKDYLKDTDVSKVEVNSAFQSNVDKEKARMARKRKRMNDKKGKIGSEIKQETSRPSDKEIGEFFTDTEKSETTNLLRLRPGSMTSIVSIGSMVPADSEHIFDQTGDTNTLNTENTLDDFGNDSKLVDLEDEFGSSIHEDMDNKSVYSTASVGSSHGIKPYKSDPQPINPDNWSLRDIGCDVTNGSSTNNAKTKQKLMHSRHTGRPMSESMLRIAGKPPLPPPSSKLARPHSDTVPRSMHSYSRYMAVDTDLF